MIEHLPEDHPEIVRLLNQLQAQHGNIGKVPSVVGFLNVDYLRTQLYNYGWNTRLAEDGKTVLLVPVD